MSGHPRFVSSSPAILQLAESIAADWDALGMDGYLLARNIDTGDQLGFNTETPVPLASVVKVPLALAVLESIADDTLDAAQQVTIDPATASFGPTGVAAFQHPATLAVGDLLYQALTVSDNACADVLIDLVGLDALAEHLRAWGCHGIAFRHRMQRMYDCAVGVAGHDFNLAREFAIRDESPDGHHAIETLNVAHANTGSAAALVDLLQRVWLDRISTPTATAELRRLMSYAIFTHRLSSDLRADTLRVSAKTGTFLHLRHEIGVIEDETGERIAIAALTKSRRKAAIAHDIDLVIGAAARTAFEALRH